MKKSTIKHIQDLYIEMKVVDYTYGFKNSDMEIAKSLIYKLSKVELMEVIEEAKILERVYLKDNLTDSVVKIIRYIFRN